MKFTYEDLLSGVPIFVDGIGHFRSPKISELNPTIGIGSQKYGLYINMLSWSKSNIIEMLRKKHSKRAALFSNADSLNTFDVISLSSYLLEILCSSLNFFLCEFVEWDATNRCFGVYTSDGLDITGVKKDESFVGKELVHIGEINRDNYDIVRGLILQMNYIHIDQEDTPIRYSNERAKTAWEKAQGFLKKENKSTKKEKLFGLGNIISKLSILPTGYTLFNIYNLTVFQLYDQFMQYGHLRAMDLTEKTVATHGCSDGKFRFEDWLLPV